MSITTVLSALLAHQGGWDEILMVVVPVGIFAALLYAANKRVANLGEDEEVDPHTDEHNQRAGPL